MSQTDKAHEFFKAAQNLKDRIIEDRRTIHRKPELGMEEVETQRLVLDRLAKLGIEAHPVAKTGVLGILRGGRAGEGTRVVACRADMDALPIQEANDHDYKSRVDGKMHACGHDAHTAMLLGVAELLVDRREELPGTVKFFFQPAEEGPGGAIPMIEEGVMENPAVDAVLGLHVQSALPAGTIGFCKGYAFAGADTLHITIKGVGGHGAHPHLGVDPVACAAQVINCLQTISSRETDPQDPVVITVGRIQGGTRANIIAEKVEMSATVRALDADTRKELPARIERIVAGVCQAMRAEYELEYDFGYDPLLNDDDMIDLTRRCAIEVVGQDSIVDVPPTMGGEDFSYFAQKAPGAYFRLGVGNEEKGIVYPMHHPKFDVDESALPIGTAVTAYSAWRFLEEGSQA